MKQTLIAIIAIALLSWNASGWAASTKKELADLKAQVSEMQEDLADIKKLLEEGARAPAPAAAAARRPEFQEQVITVEGYPYLGEADAQLTLMEFSDYQCPYCARIYRDVLPTLKSDYIDTGKLKLVMREYPLESIHPDAMSASIAALCAGDQGQYWEMHDLLFTKQRQINQDNLKTFAQDLGLNAPEFNECLDDNKYEARVRTDLAEGKKMGISGTPGFFLGITDADNPDEVKFVRFMRGAQPLTSFKAHIDNLLDNAN